MSRALLVEGLSVRYHQHGQRVRAVEDVSLHLSPGEIVGLVGESGCGKSTIASAVMGLLAPHEVQAGSIRLGETELSGLGEGTLRRIRGRDIAMVFQDPQAALNPLISIGSHLREVICRHQDKSGRAATDLALEKLRNLGIADAAGVMRRYPHQLSGGMCQRVGLAMATASNPRVLIADEPTSALDVTTQAQVLNQIVGLVRDFGTAVLFITHDLGVAARICDRIMVMAGGRIVEEGPCRQILSEPGDARTSALLKAVPRLDAAPPSSSFQAGQRLLEVDDWSISHRTRVDGRKRDLRAVDHISLNIARGEILALVGESGCGKSTLAHALAGLHVPGSGTMRIYNGDADSTGGGRSPRIQIVFQNPGGSLSPRRTVWQSLVEPLAHFRICDSSQWTDKVAESLAQVELGFDIASRLPSELSGGQSQRVALARAIISNPRLIVADEPLSFLDVTVQARILALISRLRAELGVSFLIISHDLAAVRQVADRVAVMYLGKIVETAPAERLFSSPAHPYTRMLLAAARSTSLSEHGTEPLSVGIQGEPPSPLTPPAGCVFHTRCPDVMTHCGERVPACTILGGKGNSFDTHTVNCHLYEKTS